jgi:hypothetical protein
MEYARLSNACSCSGFAKILGASPVESNPRTMDEQVSEF